MKVDMRTTRGRSDGLGAAPFTHDEDSSTSFKPPLFGTHRGARVCHIEATALAAGLWTSPCEDGR